MKQMLACSLLRFYDTLISYLEKHPLGEYDGLKMNNHPLVSKVERSLQQCGASENLFDDWKKGVIEGFQSKNFFSLALKDVQGPQKKKMMIDPRTLIEVVDQQSHAMDGMQKELIKVTNQMNRMEETMDQILEQNQAILDGQQKLLGMRKVDQRKEAQKLAQQGMESETVFENHETWECIFKKWNQKDLSPRSTFIMWFNEALWKAYHKKGLKEDKDRSLILRLKKVVKVIIILTGRYPKSLGEVRGLAEDSMKRLARALGKAASEITNTEVQKNHKELCKDLSWPADMSHDDKKIFGKLG